MPSGGDPVPETSVHVTDRDLRPPEPPVGALLRPEVGVTEDAGTASAEAVFRLDDIGVHYGSFLAVRDVTLDVRGNEITALIGPSGCGKSTLLRCLNRMNDLIPGARVSG